MKKKSNKDLEKEDLLAIIEEQKKEINSLKSNIKDLENKVKQKEKEVESITDVSSKMNKVLEEAEEYLVKIKEAHAEVTEYLNNVKTADKSEVEEKAESITNEKKLEDTNAEKEVNVEEINEGEQDQLDVDKEKTKTETSEKVNTKDEGQIVEEDKSNMMLIPIQTDLAIIEPIYIKRKKTFMLLVYFVSMIIILFSASSCYKVYSQDDRTVKLTEGLRNYVVQNDKEDLEDIVNFEELKKINPDTCGWIKVDGIEIDMPVVQTDNNDFYLKYSFDKSYNLSGWAFVDYRNKLDGTDKNIIIYGHNRRDNIMFSPLVNITEPDWYNNENNKNITFINEKGEKIVYEICSIYQTEVEDYYLQTDFSNDKEYQKFLDTIKSRSIKTYDVSLDTNDQILTLSTCGNNSKFRVILHAKKVK